MEVQMIHLFTQYDALLYWLQLSYYIHIPETGPTLCGPSQGETLGRVILITDHCVNSFMIVLASVH